MSTFTTPESEADNYEFMMEAICKYVNPRINECFERYNFLNQNQKEGESFEHFLTECRHLIRSCNYNIVDPNESVEDKALHHKIVMGIRDPTTREALVRVDKLTLEKAIHHCRTSEQSKSQNQQFDQGAIGEIGVNEVKRNRKSVSTHNNRVTSKHVDKYRRDVDHSAPTYSSQHAKTNDKYDSGKKFQCKRCQRVHGARECPAYGKKCNRCGLMNHFSVSCS